MEILLFLVILILSIILTIYVKNSIHLKKNIEKIEKENQLIIEENLKLKSKNENFYLNLYKLEKEAFENGIVEGVKRNNIFVKIEPIENIANSNFWILKKESIEIGFEYQLFINNIPTEFKSTHILKTLKKSELNEENINKIINGIEQIESLRNGNFIISNSIKLVKENLMKQLTKK